jgi:hypothetical protein
LYRADIYDNSCLSGDLILVVLNSTDLAFDPYSVGILIPLLISFIFSTIIVLFIMLRKREKK